MVERHAELTALMAETSFWSDPDTGLCIEHGTLRSTLSTLQDLTRIQSDLDELFDWQDLDDDFISLTQDSLNQLTSLTVDLKDELVFPLPEHKYPAMITINAGSGGQESQHWVRLLFRAYTMWASSKGWKVDLISWTDGLSPEVAKSITLKVQGRNAYGWMRSEHGTHRFCRVSPFDSGGRVHTSFVAVEVVPESSEEEVDIILLDSELEIKTYRSSGPGGQHANKTDSAVRIKHIPSGITVACQSERSQTLNKQQARKMLVSKLDQLAREEAQEAEDLRHGEKPKASFGHQIRSYELHQNAYIKDHRTSTVVYQPQKVLDGDFELLSRVYCEKQAFDQ